MSVDAPRLATQPLDLLRTSPASFHSTYGDYYLSTLCIGADTSTFLSSSSSIDLKSEMRDIEVKAHAFGMTKTVYADRGASESAADDCDVTFCGFDTLSGFQLTAHATNRQRFEEIRGEAARNVAGGLNLDKRVREVLQTLNLGRKDEVSMAILTAEQCKTVCRSGVVVELLFLPYAGLRDYVVATSTRAL